MEHKDYYKILGVSRKDDEKAIKKAFRRLARQFHPDLNPGDQEAERRFQEINQAYEVLSDKENRARYDRFGPSWKRAREGPSGARGGSPFDFSYSTVKDFDFSGFSHLFEDARGGGGSRGRRFQTAEAADRTESIEVTLHEAVKGSQRSITVERKQVCSVCSGVGVSGQGRVCDRCRGRAQETIRRTLDVKIPPGVTQDSKIRVRGEGNQIRAGSRPGDLYLKINLQTDGLYEVKGHDLHRELAVPLYIAVLGGPVDLDTPHGQITLKLPPETSGGRQFRLTGQGLPRSGGKPAGNLYVKVRLEVPESLSEQERDLFQKLADLRPNS